MVEQEEIKSLSVWRVCTKCKIKQPPTNFYRSAYTSYGLKPQCKACDRVYAKHYRKKNLIKVQKYNKEYRKKHYIRLREKHLVTDRDRYYKGISPNYIGLLEKQGYVCAICLKPETTKVRGKQISLSWDHDHKTGTPRGLLCGNCNRMLGLAKDDVSTLENARRYLLLWNKKRSL